MDSRIYFFLLLLLGVVVMVKECPPLEVINYAYPTHLYQYPQLFGISETANDAPILDIVLAKIPSEFYPDIKDGLTYPFGKFTGVATKCNLLPGIPEKFYSLLLNKLAINDLKRRLEYLENNDKLDELKKWDHVNIL